MRFLLKLGCGLVLLVGLVLGLCFIFIDPLVKGVIEKGGSYATSVPTSISTVKVGFVSGTLRLEGLKLENPEGFRKQPFLELGTARSSWENSSLVSDEIRVAEIEIADVTLLLERANGATNYGKILESLGRFESGDSATPQPDPDSAGSKSSQRKLVVQRIVIRNVKATVVLGDLGGLAGPLTITVPKIQIDDFHSDGSTVEIVANLVSAVVQSILESTLAAGSGTLPKELQRDLEKNLKDLKGLKGVLDEASKSFKGFDDAVKDVEKLFK